MSHFSDSLRGAFQRRRPQGGARPMQSKIFRPIVCGAAIALSSLSIYAQAQTLQVRIVHREESKKELTATIPNIPDLKSGDKSNADNTSSEKSEAKPAAPPQK